MAEKMTFNKNEVVLEKIRQASFYNLEDGKLELRITSIEEPTLACQAEGEDVTDAQGNLITTIYKAKQATFGGSNSLFSFDLAAKQLGTNKEVTVVDEENPDNNKTITCYAYEIFDVNGATVTLKNKPNVDSIKYIYALENGEIGKSYVSGAAASDEQFVVANDGTVTLPTSVTSGRVYIEYSFESLSAARVVNEADKFPTAGRLVILAYFRDKCTDKLYSGAVVCPKAKLSPESVDFNLTPTGKHPFEFKMMKDYCNDLEDELFEIIINE